jgi:type I restriction enzyme S subunit
MKPSEGFQLLATAQDGVARLRELILLLAVQGKLVPQDPNDEPASELLKLIASSKAGKISEPSHSLEDGERPFDIPESWYWTRFGSVFSLEYGDNLPAPKRSNSGEFPVYGSNGVVGSHSECSVRAPCIVVGRKGSAGALNLCLSSGCWVTDVAYYCIPPKELDLQFCFKLFHTLGLDELGKGIKPGLSRSEAYVLPVAIPPLAEQRRIVAKVDELMHLCDELETHGRLEAEQHARLTATLFEALAASESSHALAENWSRIAAHFDLLLDRPEAVDALEQTILQLAVRGLLVPQDANDEPASELLRKIRLQKDRLIAEGEIKRDKPTEPIADDDTPFDVPDGWHLVCRSCRRVISVPTSSYSIR